MDEHSRSQSLRFFWPAAGIESSGSNHLRHAPWMLTAFTEPTILLACRFHRFGRPNGHVYSQNGTDFENLL